MGIFGTLACGFVERILSTMAEAVPGRGDEIDRLCGELGWPVDGRQAGVALLNFCDPAGGLRTLSVWPETGGAIGFAITSRGYFASLPASVSDYLLRRNPRLEVASWATEAEGDGVAIGLLHRAFRLDAAGFQRVCRLMVNEVLDFDAKLRFSGLLGG